jgi:RNA 2',3'-cyclic 3'-phosphodiesterase
MDLVNRTFVGIRIPEPVVQQIEHCSLLIKRKPGGSDLRWNAPSELLITLCAFGELSLETIARLKQVLPAVCEAFPPMRICVQGFNGVPNLIQPRYAVASLTGDVEKLTELEAAMWRAAGQVLGPRDANKPFQPHIVLGRLKTESDPLRVALGRALKTADQPLMGVLDVQAVELLVSSASTSGIGYQVVDQFPLRG